MNEKCLLSNPDLTPKPGFYAYQNLTAFFDARYAPVEFTTKPVVTVRDQGQFSGIGENDDAYPSIPLVAGYRTAGGASLVAYWLPWQPQEYTPKPARISLRVPGAKFTAPVLVNLLDGSVHSLPPPRDEYDAAVFADLPLFDFPLVIAERTEVSVGASRLTPAHDAIPTL